MYICSICNKTFETQESIAKHSLKCWRENNPNHQSMLAPHSEDITERKISNEILNFFDMLKGVSNARSDD